MRRAAQAGDGVALEIDLRPAQLEPLQRLAGLGIFCQAIDLAIGHVKGHSRVGPIGGLNQQAHAHTAVFIVFRGKRKRDAPFDHRLRGLLKVQRQAPANQAIVGRHGPA